MNSKQFFWSLAATGVLLTAMPAAWSAGYGGNWLEVRVVDKSSGSPVAQAAVCLGTRAQRNQFGALRATANGMVRFHDLPVNRMVVVASRDGYQGKQQDIEPLSGNRVIVLSMVPGGGGPVCAGAQAVDEPKVAAKLEITSAQVAADTKASSGAQVLVTVGVSAQANQIRIAESANFAGALWQELKPHNRYTLSQGSGVKRLFVQVRRQIKTRGASLEVLSAVRVLPYQR